MKSLKNFHTFIEGLVNNKINKKLTRFRQLFPFMSRQGATYYQKNEMRNCGGIIYSILGNRSILELLLVVNIVGTVYGYYWYGWQLEETPAIFLPLSLTVRQQACFLSLS